MEREENNHCIGKRLLQEYDYSLAWCDSKTYVDLSYCTEAQKGKSWENWLISQDGIHWPYEESGQSLLGPHNRHWDVNYSPGGHCCVMQLSSNDERCHLREGKRGNVFLFGLDFQQINQHCWKPVPPLEMEPNREGLLITTVSQASHSF